MGGELTLPGLFAAKEIGSWQAFRLLILLAIPVAVCLAVVTLVAGPLPYPSA